MLTGICFYNMFRKPFSTFQNLELNTRKLQIVYNVTLKSRRIFSIFQGHTITYKYYCHIQNEALCTKKIISLFVRVLRWEWKGGGLCLCECCVGGYVWKGGVCLCVYCIVGGGSANFVCVLRWGWFGEGGVR